MDGILSPAKTSQGGIVTLRGMLRARLCLGFYCDLSDRAALRCLGRIYCLCLAYAATVVLINSVDTPIILLVYLPRIFDYDLNMIISFITGETDLFSFCKTIQRADAKLGFDRLPLLTRAVGNTFLFLLGYHTVLSGLIVIANFEVMMNASNLAIILMTTAANMNCLNNSITLDLLRSRLVLLRYALELNLRHHNSNRISTSHLVETLGNYLILYKTMIDNLNETFSWTKLRIFARLVGVFVIFLTEGFIVVWYFKNDALETEHILSMTILIWVIVLTCLPAIFAELVAREVDKFKIVIGNGLLECNDGELREALERAAEYLELRPFRVSIWRVITLDVSFIMSFIGLCTTYFIVIIQITGII